MKSGAADEAKQHPCQTIGAMTHPRRSANTHMHIQRRMDDHKLMPLLNMTKKSAFICQTRFSSGKELPKISPK
jgi:hypothetical protein